MTYDKLISYLNKEINQAPFTTEYYPFKPLMALRAVVKLHKPDKYKTCIECTRGISPSIAYPCPTIEAINEVLA